MDTVNIQDQRISVQALRDNQADCIRLLRQDPYFLTERSRILAIASYADNAFHAGVTALGLSQTGFFQPVGTDPLYLAIDDFLAAPHEKVNRLASKHRAGLIYGTDFAGYIVVMPLGIESQLKLVQALYEPRSERTEYGTPYSLIP